MTEGDALYQVILEEPLKDDLRMIYADWLEDNGQPERAEFIRVQVELARLKGRMPAGVWTNDRLRAQGLEKRQQQLWDQSDTKYGWKLIASNLPSIPTPARWNHGLVCMVDAYNLDNYYALYRRGFLDEIRAPINVLEACLPAIVKLHPITRVLPTDRSPGGGPGIGFFWHDDRRYESVMISGSPYVPGLACDQMVKDGWRYNLISHPPRSSLRTSEDAFDALSKAMLKVSRHAS